MKRKTAKEIQESTFLQDWRRSLMQLPTYCTVHSEVSWTPAASSPPAIKHTRVCLVHGTACIGQRQWMNERSWLSSSRFRFWSHDAKATILPSPSIFYFVAHEEVGTSGGWVRTTALCFFFFPCKKLGDLLWSLFPTYQSTVARARSRVLFLSLITSSWIGVSMVSSSFLQGKNLML